jgi:hypothetical protein
MGTIVLAQAHLPAVLLVPGEGDKEVIVDPTNTQAHALVLQHLQNGDQKPLPDPATKGSKGQERRTSMQSPSSSLWRTCSAESPLPTDCAMRARKLNKEHGERVKAKKAICIKEER